MTTRQHILTGRNTPIMWLIGPLLGIVGWILVAAFIALALGGFASLGSRLEKRHQLPGAQLTRDTHEVIPPGK